jgi:hypothetical protein
MNKILLRLNEIQISKTDLKELNQKVTIGDTGISLFQYYMRQKGLVIQDHNNWELLEDGYYQFCFKTDNSMNVLNRTRDFLREFLLNKRIHVYILSGRKYQYYQMVPKKDEYLELEVGYSLKNKDRLIKKLKQDIKDCSEYLNHPDYDSITGGDGYSCPLFHTKVIRREVLFDECHGDGVDSNETRPIIHTRDLDVDHEEQSFLKQYSFFANTFNYKESMLLDSLRILKRGFN